VDWKTDSAVSLGQHT